jgi:hypothetical protein
VSAGIGGIAILVASSIALPLIADTSAGISTKVIALLILAVSVNAIGLGTGALAGLAVFAIKYAWECHSENQELKHASILQKTLEGRSPAPLALRAAKSSETEVSASRQVGDQTAREIFKVALSGPGSGEPLHIKATDDPSAVHPLWDLGGSGRTASKLCAPIQRFQDILGQYVRPGENDFNDYPRAALQSSAEAFLRETSTLLADGTMGPGEDARGAYFEMLILALNTISPDAMLADVDFNALANHLLVPATAREILGHLQGQRYPFFNGMFIDLDRRVVDFVRRVAAADWPGLAAESAQPDRPIFVEEIDADGNQSVGGPAASPAGEIAPRPEGANGDRGTRVESSGDLNSASPASVIGAEAARQWDAEIAAARGSHAQNSSRNPLTRGILIATLRGIGADGGIRIGDDLLTNLETALKIRHMPSDEGAERDIGGINIPARWHSIVLAMVAQGGERVADAAKDTAAALREAGGKGNAANAYMKQVLMACKEFLNA